MRVVFFRTYRAVLVVSCLLSLVLIMQSCTKEGACVGSFPAFVFRLQDVGQQDAFKRGTSPLIPDSVRMFELSPQNQVGDIIKVFFYTENDPAGTPRQYIRSQALVEKAANAPSARFLLRYKTTMADTIIMSVSQLQKENCTYYKINKVLLNGNPLTQNDRFSNAYIITRPF